MRAAIFVVLCSLAAGVLKAQCPSYWTQYGQNCYRSFGTERTWRDAEADCIIHTESGGSISHLASIHDTYENSFVHDYWYETLGANYNGFWIGGSDEDREGKTNYLNIINFHRKLKCSSS